jgi:hypothetical protein
VNNIATQALVAVMAHRKNTVDRQSARTVVSEITTDYGSLCSFVFPRDNWS